MKVLHILGSGTIGGIEKLCLDIGKHSNHHFCYLKRVGSIIDEMEKLNIPNFSVFNSNVKYGMLKILPAYRKIKQYIQNNDIKSIVFHTNSLFAWVLIILLKDSRTKIALYAHSNYDDFIGKSAKKRYLIKIILAKFIFFKIEKMIAISYSVKNSILSNLKINPDKIKIIYNGIDLSMFKYDDNKNVSNRINILYVGRLIEEKGVQNTLELLSQIKDVEYKFSVIGDGPYKNNLINLSKELKIDKNVDFLGERIDVPLLIKNYDFFIHLPNWEEGFGITVVEAMASGLICIVNSKGAMEELVNDNVSGFVLREQNKLMQFTQILKNYSKNRYYDIRVQALEKAKLFSIRNTVINIEDIFK